ncbi:MAG: tetratricopeptide repeat protein [Saprospiraceae bacterium]
MYNHKILIILFAFFLNACQPTMDNASQPAEETMFSDIPELLDRAPSLRYEKEWDQVQSTYVRYRNELATNPEKVEARLRLAEVFTNEARVTGEHGHYYPAALKVLDEALSRSKQNPDEQFRALAMKAGVLLSLHQFSEALEVGQAALAMNPYNAQTYGILVDAFVELGQYDQAVEMADKMVNIRPDLRSYARISYLREIYGDVDGAIEAMQLAVDAGYPGYEQTAWARLMLGQRYAQYGEMEKAEMEFQRILIDRPGYPFAIAALGDIALKRGEEAKAEQLLKEAAAAIPEFSFYEKLATIYQKQGRTETFNQTIGDLLVMLQEDQEAGHIMDLELAHLHAELLHDYPTALTYAMKVYEQRPENIEVNRTLAYIYKEMGEATKAQEQLEKASRTNSRHPDLLRLKEQLASL